MLDHFVAALGVVLLAAACIYWPVAHQEYPPAAVDQPPPSYELENALIEQGAQRTIYDHLEEECVRARAHLSECPCPVGRCKQGRRPRWPALPHCSHYYRDVKACPDSCDDEPDARLRSWCEAVNEQRKYTSAMERTAARLAELCFIIMRLQNATMPDQRCRQCEVRGYDTVEDCRAED
jgi:hypothetical protein